MINRESDYKSQFKTKEKKDGEMINLIEVSGKLKFKADDIEDMYAFCSNDRQLAGKIGQAMELKLKEFFNEINSLSYKYKGTKLVKAINEIMITTVD